MNQTYSVSSAETSVFLTIALSFPKKLRRKCKAKDKFGVHGAREGVKEERGVMICLGLTRVIYLFLEFNKMS